MLPQYMSSTNSVLGGT